MEKKKFDLKKIFYFGSKLNSNFKKGFLFSLFIFIIIIIRLFNLGFTSSWFWTFWFAFILIFALIFPEDSQEMGKIIFILILVFFVIILLFSWLHGGNIPYTNIKADNNTIVALFTIILAIATIINIVVSKESIGFSRLPELDFNLNKILCVEIENKGNYPARGITLSTRITDKQKMKGWQKRRFIDLYTSPEFKKHYLPSNERYAEKLSDYLEKRFEIKYDKNKEKHTSIKRKSFKVRLVLNYHSDTFFKNPLPIIKEYEIEVDSAGMTKKEIKPSED